MNKRRSIAYRAIEARQEQLIETIDLTLDSPIRDQNVTKRKIRKATVPSISIQEIFCCDCHELFIALFCVSFKNCPHQRCISCAILLIKQSETVRVECSICKGNAEDDEIRHLLTQQEYSNYINKNKHTIYTELMKLEEQSGFIQSPDEFECEICTMQIDVGDGMMIRSCLHQFCIDCIRAVIINGTEAEVRCPAATCDQEIQDREIRSLVTQKEYDDYSIRMMKTVESQCSKTYHCKKPDCQGWAIVEDDVIIFKCPVCTSINCLSCQAIHPGMNCLEYHKQQGKDDEEITNRKIDEIVNRGLGMRCPKCMIVIMKRDGCDWLRCAICKTEICWATKQSRWGPRGRGDISGGCKCSIFKRCSPLCKNCH